MHHSAAALPSEKVALATKEAKKEGIFAGLTSALASTLIGSKALGLKRYPALACGAITAVLSGYYFTEAFTAAHLAKLERDQELLRRQVEEKDAGSL
ncbi:hypothetical protein EV361DRAFT_950795 [Lentinula raphanica]|nr:hypothetical protein EV360DRAFT_78423 [Lentinula raphanica]KAJ3771495.1 hypothetical protein FB446DRAFT_789559 [Lentinula raphanica]KAJ3825320.1 hypothetical protein F5880DRAFT_251845 [Lentinula raphanica]KAJ3970195.1 hypothetical protein EV361DRAFT_950795 [Lentinula raphanica]